VLAKVARKNSMRALNELTAVVDGRRVMVPDPPRTVRIDNELADRTLGEITQFFESYKNSMPLDQRVLVNQFSLVDVVRKVVGVGSVGTRCLIVLLEADDGTSLFLQFKQATQSVLEQYNNTLAKACLNRPVNALWRDSGSFRPPASCFWVGRD
jgi:uncharacterized protein (DUF2252 family)